MVSTETLSQWCYRLRGEVDGAPLCFTVDADGLTIGALDCNDIVLAVRGVSRRHARLEKQNGSVRIVDLGSKNGTYINGLRIVESEAEPGDWIEFGPVQLRLERVDREDADIAISLVGQLEPARVAGPEEGKTGSHSMFRAHRPGTWLECLDEVADNLIGSFDPNLGAAVAALARGLGSSGALFCQWDGSDLPLVISAWGDEPDFADRKEIRGALGRLSDVGRAEPLLLSGHVDSGDPLLWVAAAQPESLPRGLIVRGGFMHWEQAEPLLRVVLRMLLHAEPEPVHFSLGGGRVDLPTLVFPAGFVVGQSRAMTGVYDQLRQLILGDIPVLITGETGVGKEHIACTLHRSSRRSHGEFVAVNCAAIPAELLESELFGIEKGVATGVDPRPGKFRQAEGGVLFLDEISETPLPLQAKLLRAVQEREIHPVGGRRPVPIDVRVVAATNTDLQQWVRDGRFRSDLYYRVAGYTLRVPPLRERREDIPLFVGDFLRRFTAEVGKSVRGITVKVLRALVNAYWQGNVRELEHEVRRLVYLSTPGQAIDSSLLAEHILHPTLTFEDPLDERSSDLRLDTRVEGLERRLITVALARARGNRSRAAKLLGISRNGLAIKMSRLEPGTP